MIADQNISTDVPTCEILIDGKKISETQLVKSIGIIKEREFM